MLPPYRGREHKKKMFLANKKGLFMVFFDSVHMKRVHF